MSFRILLALALVAGGSASAAPVFEGGFSGEAFYVADTGNNEEASAVATDSEGNVYVTGLENSDGTFVAKLDKDMRTLWYHGGVRFTPFATFAQGIVVKDGLVYVCGQYISGNTYGFIMAWRAADGSPAWPGIYLWPGGVEGTECGFSDMCADPVGTGVWLVGTQVQSSGADQTIRVYHADTGGNVDERFYFNEGGNPIGGSPSRGHCIAVTPSRVYIAGEYDNAGHYGRIWARKHDGSLVWSWGTEANRDFGRHGLAVRPAGGTDRIYSLYSDYDCFTNPLELMQHSYVDGTVIGNAQTVVSSYDCGMLLARGGLALHPETGWVVAVGGNRIRLYDPDLAFRSEGEYGFSGGGFFSGVAVSPGLLFRSYVASTQGITPNTSAKFLMMRSVLNDVPEDGFIRATPNVTSLSDPDPVVYITVRARESNMPGTVWVFDSAGRTVAAIDVKTDANKFGSVKWNVRKESGERLGAGVYWLVTSSEIGSGKAGFMVKPAKDK
jgi:hypothetical protein